MDMNNQRAWAFKTINKNELRYRGNDGYDDNPFESYSYDNFVANHKQVETGDIVVIYDRERVIGVAKITSLIKENSHKEINQCPINNCDAGKIRTRTNKTPEWRCSNGHEFDKPLKKSIPVIKYTAFYSNNFKMLKMSYLELEGKIINHNKQLSIQEVKLEWAKDLWEGNGSYIDNLGCLEASEPEALFDKEDLREIVNRSIKQRRGQRSFREKILKKNNHCAITKCAVLDILEAAHIYPYRNKSHNHISNGILLRADIHTLFDLDLIAIAPESFTVHINNKLKDSEYSIYEGSTLSISHELSLEAIEERWAIFIDKNK
ncbi:HNH endonuclease [Salmonella enterica]|nr:HNH endonuclease [Salmonella enterica]